MLYNNDNKLITMEKLQEISKNSNEFKKRFPAWWQGGNRYTDIISYDGVKLSLPFENNAVYADLIWNQLHEDIKIHPIDIYELFQNNNPINLEIGIGNGDFIAGQAANNKNENWLGVEVFKQAFVKAEKKINALDYRNAKIIQFDAALILQVIPNNSLNNIYVNFPDPWPKKKHHKRRLLKTAFIELMRDKIIPNGTINIITDHYDYACEIAENIQQVKNIQSLNGNTYQKNVADYFKTKYYKKFADKHGTYFFKYIKM